MKIPKARKLPSGVWFIQLRLGGQSVSVTMPTEKECTREAGAIKAEYLRSKRLPKEDIPQESLTLSEAIDTFISAKKNVLSPVTIRGYKNIQKHRFQRYMPMHLSSIAPEEWQVMINQESAVAAPKTVKNSWGLVRSVVKFSTGSFPPDVKLPTPVKNTAAFLQPEEILPFVNAVKDTKYAVPLLLALSSLRISEIRALQWSDIPDEPNFIKVRGAVVPDEKNQLVRKNSNKNISSSRNVPILIPELKEVLKRDRKPDGGVMRVSQCALLRALHKICIENGITDVTVHGLRHSFASLAYHLQIPEEIIMEIGGWSDRATMRNIYTHIAQSDITRYQNALCEFYRKKC